MADEERQAEVGEGDASGAKRGRSVTTMGVFGAVMVAEGLAIFLCMKFLGSEPDPTQGLDGLEPTTQPWAQSPEVQIAELRVLNRTGTRSTLYNVRVVVTVREEDRKTIEDFLKNRESTVADAMSQVIRRAEEVHLAEPGLETLRRQLRFELNRLIGDDTIIEQVLIPEFTPIPTGV
ncbi:MAG: hypothetical protein JXQ75_21540 [Phycisphaerae bacterium]|nr:hypothetical protein [Phycisphaerae bacterium]